MLGAVVIPNSAMQNLMKSKSFCASVFVILVYLFGGDEGTCDPNPHGLGAQLQSSPGEARFLG